MNEGTFAEAFMKALGNKRALYTAKVFERFGVNEVFIKNMNSFTHLFADDSAIAAYRTPSGKLSFQIFQMPPSIADKIWEEVFGECVEILRVRIDGELDNPVIFRKL